MRDLGRCGSGGDRSKPSDPFLARTADPIPLSIQGVKRATAPQARTPEDAGRRGDRCSGCANAYDVDWKQLVIQRLCGFCATPRDSGSDRVPIELPAGGAELLHCREKRGLLGRSPAPILIHGEGGSVTYGTVDVEAPRFRICRCRLPPDVDEVIFSVLCSFRHHALVPM
jgi:hypothetical protein